MCAKDYPVKTSGGVIKVNFSYRREESGLSVSFAADKAVPVDYIRVAPFNGPKITAGELPGRYDVEIKKLQEHYFLYIFIKEPLKEICFNVNQ